MAFVSRYIEPGVIEAKVHKFELVKRPYQIEGENILDLVVHLESKAPGGNFKGATIPGTSDFYAGQIGRVKWSQFGFRNTTLPDLTVITVESEIARALKSFCMEIGQYKWFMEKDEELPTKESFIQELNASGIFKDHYLFWCIGSRQYQKGQYLNNDLFLPKYSKEFGKPFSSRLDDLAKFNPAKHVIKPKEAGITSSVDKPKDVPTNTTHGYGNLGQNNDFLNQSTNDDLPF